MNVFVTGASGYIGAVVVERLIAAGHQVTGLARSGASAAKLELAGVDVVHGNLREPEVWAASAAACDAVIHLAMGWEPGGGQVDRAAVETLLHALRGSGKAFLYTSGVWVMGPTQGRLAGEMFPIRPPTVVAGRPAVERLVLDAIESGVRGVVIRPATVYGRGGGPIQRLVRGQMPLIGDGENHWSFVHVEDLAHLYLLALERSPAAELYIAADGPPQKSKDVAAAAGCASHLSLEDARKAMGHVADALVMDQKVGSTKAGRLLGWRPTRRGVLEELRAGLRIRSAVPADTALILEFIRGLAEYEKLSHEMIADEALLGRHLFGPKPMAEVILAEWDGSPAGFALFFHNFSTFLGRPGIYLEDLFVLPGMRGRGIGKALLTHLAVLAQERGCGRLEWSVLDWNQPSIDFYKKLGAVAMEEWSTFRVTGDALRRLAGGSA